MLRSGPARLLARSTIRGTTSPGTRKISNLIPYAPKTLSPCVKGFKRPSSLALTAYRPLSTSLQRLATATPPFDEPDKKELQHERSVAKEELEPHPEEVSIDSSVHQLFHEQGTPDVEKEEDMLAGVYQDLVRHLELIGGCKVYHNTDAARRKSSKRPLLSTRFPAKLSSLAWPDYFLM